MLITKSRYLAGSQCLKRLYLIAYSPELAAQRDDTDQAIIDQGQEVGLLARQMFPGGVTVESCDREQAIRMTQELIANPAVPAIFEGAFEFQGVFVRVDILQRRRDQRWRLIEVKSTTDAKDHHLDDVAIQHRVVTRSGVDLAASCLAHVSREYIYEGGTIDAHRFFRIRNLTLQVERLQPELTVQLRSEFRVLAMPEAPQIPAGRQCSDPFTCEFFDHCNPPLPERSHYASSAEFMPARSPKLVALGVQSIHDIPESYPLTERLRRACTSVQMRKPWYGPELRDELGKLKYPISFVISRHVNPAIPRFAGMRPYDQLPFQWIGSCADSSRAQRRNISNFLATDASDPRQAFISTLC